MCTCVYTLQSVKMAQQLTPVLQPSTSASDSSPYTSSDTDSPSWNFESETDGPMSSTSSAGSNSDSGSNSTDEEPTSQAENDVKRARAGAQLTYSESLLLLLRYSLIHALTKRAFEDLLRLVALFLPTAEKTSLPSSVYVLKRAFVEVFPSVPVRKVLYCINCQALLNGSSLCGKSSCSGRVKDFVFIPIYQQLKLKLEGK